MPQYFQDGHNVSQENPRFIDLNDTILNAFRPFEHLFRIMNRVSRLGSGIDLGRRRKEDSIWRTIPFRRQAEYVWKCYPKLKFYSINSSCRKDGMAL
jgi:hypothetical protein